MFSLLRSIFDGLILLKVSSLRSIMNDVILSTVAWRLESIEPSIDFVEEIVL